MKTLDILTPTSKIAGLEWGNPDGKPVLALHGWLDNANSFQPISSVLCQNPDIRLVAIDFPGHGRSGHRPPGAIYHFLDFLADIASVADFLEWDRFTILGHSMGGGLGSLFAGAFPDRLEKLVLIEALGPVTREARDAPEYLGKSIRRYLEQGKKSDTSEFRDLEQLLRLRLRAGELRESSARLLMERGSEKTQNGVRLLRDPRLNLPSFVRLTEEMVLEFLKRIQAPSLVVWGKNGYKWESPYLSVRTTCISNLTQVFLGGSHHLHMDEPESVGKAILDWYEKQE